jgi:hypothetical protein
MEAALPLEIGRAAFVVPAEAGIQAFQISNQPYYCSELAFPGFRPSPERQSRVFFERIQYDPLF